MVFLAQKVEHQCTKLKVAGSSRAEVHVFSYPTKCLLYSDKPGQAELGCPRLKQPLCLRVRSDCTATQVGQCNIVCHH